MIGLLMLLLKILPWITGGLTVIGGINAINATNTVVTYGASPSPASILATVVPLLLAGMSKLMGVMGQQKLNALLEAGRNAIGLSDKTTGYLVEVIDVGRIGVYAKLHSEATTDDERAKIRESADVAFNELRERLFPVAKAGK